MKEKANIHLQSNETPRLKFNATLNPLKEVPQIVLSGFRQRLAGRTQSSRISAQDVHETADKSGSATLLRPEEVLADLFLRPLRLSCFDLRNPHSLLACGKVEKSDDRGRVEQNKSQSQIANAGKRPQGNTRVRQRSQCQNTDRGNKRQPINQPGEKYRGKDHSNQSERHKQASQLVTDEFESQRIRAREQPWSNMEQMIVSKEGAHLTAIL